MSFFTNDPDKQRIIPKTPRSLLACKQQGVKPQELLLGDPLVNAQVKLQYEQILTNQAPYENKYISPFLHNKESRQRATKKMVFNYSVVTHDLDQQRFMTGVRRYFALEVLKIQIQQLQNQFVAIIMSEEQKQLAQKRILEQSKFFEMEPIVSEKQAELLQCQYMDEYLDFLEELSPQVSDLSRIRIDALSNMQEHEFEHVRQTLIRQRNLARTQLTTQIKDNTVEQTIVTQITRKKQLLTRVNEQQFKNTKHIVEQSALNRSQRDSLSEHLKAVRYNCNKQKEQKQEQTLAKSLSQSQRCMRVMQQNQKDLEMKTRALSQRTSNKNRAWRIIGRNIELEAHEKAKNLIVYDGPAIQVVEHDNQWPTF